MVEEIPRKKPLSKAELDVIEEMLRMDEDSTVKGAFTDEVLETAKKQLEQKYPDAFKEGAKKTPRTT